VSLPACGPGGLLFRRRRRLGAFFVELVVLQGDLGEEVRHEECCEADGERDGEESAHAGGQGAMHGLGVRSCIDKFSQNDPRRTHVASPDLVP
jgi:hypothetical protein